MCDAAVLSVFIYMKVLSPMCFPHVDYLLNSSSVNLSMGNRCGKNTQIQNSYHMCMTETSGNIHIGSIPLYV